MREPVARLLAEIRAAAGESHDEAVLRLWMLIEKSIGPNKRDPLHREILPDELFDLSLNEDDLVEIIAGVEPILSCEEIPLSKRAALVNLLGKIPRLESLTLVLRFFREHERGLDDESAHSVITAVCPHYLPAAQRSQALALLDKNETEGSLERVLCRNSNRLSQSVEIVLTGLRKLKSG